MEEQPRASKLRDNPKPAQHGLMSADPEPDHEPGLLYEQHKQASLLYAKKWADFPLIQ